MNKPIAVILGAGPGAGAGIARAFAPTHRIALLSRSQSTLDRTASTLQPSAEYKTFTADTSTISSLHTAWDEIHKAWPDSPVQVAIFNAPTAFKPGKFLDKTEDDFKNTLHGGVVGAFAFAQLFLKEAKSGTLIFTGATMGIRGSANFSTMAPDKFATRALSQSLAREFGPQNIHVANVIIDGLIDTEHVSQFAGQAEKGTRLDPDDIGKAYLYLHEQKKSAWTQEMDLRPSCEKF